MVLFFAFINIISIIIIIIIVIILFCFVEAVLFNIFKSWRLCMWGTLVFVYLSVVKLSGNELRDNDSPTPPLSVHNHTMNNVDYNKEGVKDKNSLHDENLLRADGAR